MSTKYTEFKKRPGNKLPRHPAHNIHKMQSILSQNISTIFSLLACIKLTTETIIHNQGTLSYMFQILKMNWFYKQSNG